MQLLIRRLGRSFGTLASGGLVGRRSWETGATKGHLMVKGETYHIVSELSPPRTRLAMRSFSRLSPLNSNGNSNGHSGPRGQADSRQASDEGQIRWYWIPASLGIAVIATQHFYHTYKDEVKRAQQQQGTGSDVAGGRVVVTGPWQVHVLSALPLKAMSRLFGWFNELTIPVPLRRPLLGFYAWLFGC
ncbi:phosphatidylserine decarboxylase 1, partial [Spiromyces aspiralis]